MEAVESEGLEGEHKADKLLATVKEDEQLQESLFATAKEREQPQESLLVLVNEEEEEDENLLVPVNKGEEPEKSLLVTVKEWELQDERLLVPVKADEQPEDKHLVTVKEWELQDERLLVPVKEDEQSERTSEDTEAFEESDSLCEISSADADAEPLLGSWKDEEVDGPEERMLDELSRTLSPLKGSRLGASVPDSDCSGAREVDWHAADREAVEALITATDKRSSAAATSTVSLSSLVSASQELMAPGGSRGSCTALAVPEGKGPRKGKKGVGSKGKGSRKGAAPSVSVRPAKPKGYANNQVETPSTMKNTRNSRSIVVVLGPDIICVSWCFADVIDASGSSSPEGEERERTLSLLYLLSEHAVPAARALRPSPLSFLQRTPAAQAKEDHRELVWGLERREQLQHLHPGITAGCKGYQGTPRIPLLLTLLPVMRTNLPQSIRLMQNVHISLHVASL